MNLIPKLESGFTFYRSGRNPVLHNLLGYSGDKLVINYGKRELLCLKGNEKREKNPLQLAEKKKLATQIYGNLNLVLVEMMYPTHDKTPEQPRQ